MFLKKFHLATINSFYCKIKEFREIDFKNIKENMIIHEGLELFRKYLAAAVAKSCYKQIL